MTSSQRPHAAILLLLLTLAAIYLLTMSPYLRGGDNGELLIVATKLTTAHPPGYPLYTLLAHLFTLIPISTIAWRAGLFSLIAQLACAALLFNLTQRWLRQTWIAALITLFYCLAPITWEMATQAEVFALNNLFAVGLLTVFYLYEETRDTKFAYAGCAILGLASCHHMTILFLAFPFFLFFIIRDWQTLLKAKTLAVGTALFAFALLPYLSLFYLGQEHSTLGWGDFNTWNGFFTHVLRREYGSFQLANSGKPDTEYLNKLWFFFKEMNLQTAFVIFPLWLWGTLRLAKRRDTFAALLSATFLFYTLLFQALTNLDLNFPLYLYTQSRMWLLPLLIMVMGAGWGLADITQKQHANVKVAVGSLLTLVLCANTIWVWPRQDRRESDFFERFGHTMLDGVEKNAVILVREDAFVNSVRYLQVVESVRPDVHIIPVDALWWPWLKAPVEKEIPGFKFPGEVLRDSEGKPGEYTLAQLVDANVDHFPLYVSTLVPREEASFRSKFLGFPDGFHSRIKRVGAEWELDEVDRETGKFRVLQLPPILSYLEASWEGYLVKNYLEFKYFMALQYVERSKRRKDWLEAAVKILESLSHEDEKAKPRTLGLLGNVYGYLASVDVQYQTRAVETWKELLRVSPEDTEATRKVRGFLTEIEAHGWAQADFKM